MKPFFLAQVFKSYDGAQKRAKFENAHCDGKYIYTPIRFRCGEVDGEPMVQERWLEYTWRLLRTNRI